MQTTVICLNWKMNLEFEGDKQCRQSNSSCSESGAGLSLALARANELRGQFSLVGDVALMSPRAEQQTQTKRKSSKQSSEAQPERGALIMQHPSKLGAVNALSFSEHSILGVVHLKGGHLVTSVVRVCNVCFFFLLSTGPSAVL